ncbi:aminoglycoside phosphotransferase [Embleya sp. MST-111070]|uniref:aminoglycoside phosphotransferase n=1 Tax=Embleya sp. MST-111070 TaxID=3398231 RepID=UPI003F740A49
MNDDDSGQRRFLRRILMQGADRLGAALPDQEKDVHFGWGDRAIGAPVTRDGDPLWLRATGEHRDDAGGEAWTGTRDAAHLDGVPKPRLVDHVEWTEDVVVIKAELSTRVDPACSPTPELRTPVEVPDTWWSNLRAALGTLAEHPTTRGRADLTAYTADLEAFYGRPVPDRPLVATEHTDLHWANLTTPSLALLDWEYWGRATRGYGAATLYCHTLLVPETATRLRTVFADVLDTPSGRHAQLSAIRFMLHRIEQGEYPDLEAPLRDLADRLLNPTRRKT